jgi:hypothetical protein
MTEPLNTRPRAAGSTLGSKLPERPIAQSGTSVTATPACGISAVFSGLFRLFSLFTLLIHVFLVIAPAETGGL